MAEPATKEDGVPRQVDPEVVRVRASRGKRNPQISEVEVRKAANQSNYGPGPTRPPEEVVVRDKKIKKYDASSVDKAHWRALRGLLSARGFTNISNAYLGQLAYNYFFPQVQLADDQQLAEDAEAYAEEVEAAMTGIPSTNPIEEIVITAPKQGAQSLGRYYFPGQIDPLSQAALMRIQDFFREHVVVTAKRLDQAIVRGIHFDWTFIQKIQVLPIPQIFPYIDRSRS